MVVTRMSRQLSGPQDDSSCPAGGFSESKLPQDDKLLEEDKLPETDDKMSKQDDMVPERDDKLVKTNVKLPDQEQPETDTKGPE